MPHCEQRSILIAYLYMKADCEDWHGVSDAANDLREIDAARRERESLTQAFPEISRRDNAQP